MVQGKIAARSEYQDFVESRGIGGGRWRPGAITLVKSFKLAPSENAEQWLARVRNALALTIEEGASINQRLKSNKGLADVLASPPEDSSAARTIHSAKGMEFPAVCVVLTTQTAGGIIDLLEGGTVSVDVEEDAREIYVAASRAERLLVLAIPKSRAPRFEQLFTSAGATVQVHDV